MLSTPNSRTNMTSSLSELIARREALDRQISDAQSIAKSNAIEAVRKLMTEHGLIMADLATRAAGRLPAREKKKVAPKYRDPVTGSTWSGRGLKPKWLQTAIAGGKSVYDFVI
jgi:DNA-binding protein H-NS